MTAIVQMAHTLKLRTVAEGIEHADQAAALRGMRCDFGQGYLYGRPMSADQIEHRLLARRSALLPPALH